MVGDKRVEGLVQWWGMSLICFKICRVHVSGYHSQDSFAFLSSEPHLPIFTFIWLPGTAAPGLVNQTLSVVLPSCHLSSLTSQQDQLPWHYHLGHWDYSVLPLLFSDLVHSNRVFRMLWCLVLNSWRRAEQCCFFFVMCIVAAVQRMLSFWSDIFNLYVLAESDSDLLPTFSSPLIYVCNV